MEIQLTKTKKISIGGGSGGKKHRATDVVGIDMFNGDERGFPAVRLSMKKGVLHVAAAGFVPPPEAGLPTSWEEASKNCVWALPAEFQAPHAAFAVTSPEMFLSQTTPEAFRSDLAAGAHRQEETSAGAPAAPKVRRLGIKRDAKSAEEKKPASSETKPVPVSTGALPEVEPGVPVSHGGTRFVMQKMSGSDGFVMEATLPEYQVLWLSRLLPEGRRPTAASIQLNPLAHAASILRHPEFKAAGGSALVLYILPDEVRIAGFKAGDLVLWRNCRGVPGGTAIREAVKKGLGLDEEIVDSVLDDNLIDPRPVMEPAIAPILDELALSRDYLVAKLNFEPAKVLAVGLASGGAYWNALAGERARLQLVACGPFDGFEGAVPEKNDASAFAGALGAALALLAEEEEVRP